MYDICLLYGKLYLKKNIRTLCITIVNFRYLKKGKQMRLSTQFAIVCCNENLQNYKYSIIYYL